MDPRAFTRRSPGELVPIPGGHAFVPGPLPSAIDLPGATVRLLSEAERAIGHLNGMTAATRSAELLLFAIGRREAVESSRIEGTEASFADVARQQVTQDVANDDVQDVLSYLSAMGYAQQRLGEIPLCLNLIREAHGVLLPDGRGRNRAPGEFRRVQVYVEGDSPSNATYVPPPPDRLVRCLDDWEKHLHTDELPLLVHGAILHYQFEAIHPFLDGNGRIGRLVNLLYLLVHDVLDQPYLDLSAYFEAYRSSYYRLLNQVSQKGDWTDWIAFYLRGVATQARMAADDCAAALELRDRYVERLDAGRANATTRRLLDMLFDNPFATIPEMARRLNVTFPTVSNAIKQLVAMGVLQEVTGKRKNREYMASEILDIFTNPPADRRE